MNRNLVLSFFMMIMCTLAWAESGQQRGLEIAKEADRRDQGFKDSKAKMTMILKNKQGDESLRELRVRVLEGVKEGDKSLIVFDSPLDVRGTALLTFSHKKDDDDQWLYLPSLKRVKRISSSNQSGPFMGSEFAYEDFSSPEVEKYDYNYVKDETFAGKPCFVVERFPVNPNSGYKRQVVWLDSQEYRIWKVDFYDRKNALLKTLLNAEQVQYLGRYWRPHTMTMSNHQTGKTTVLKWSDYAFQNGYTDSDFTQATLKRIPS